MSNRTLLLESGKEKKVIRTGNEELDRRVGGLPYPTLCLIEGENSSGKSVFAQVLTYGALKQGYLIHYITTENTVKSLLDQMESLNLNVTPYYISWNFSITSINVKGIRWNKELCVRFLEILKEFIKFLHEVMKRDIIIVDNLTHFIAPLPENRVLNFFSSLREYVDSSEVAIFLTLHPYAINQDLLIRIRSVCDGNIRFQIKEIGDQILRLIKIPKLRGARKKIDSAIGFTVDPAFGMKIIPISLAKA